MKTIIEKGADLLLLVFSASVGAGFLFVSISLDPRWKEGEGLKWKRHWKVWRGVGEFVS